MKLIGLTAVALAALTTLSHAGTSDVYVVKTSFQGAQQDVNDSSQPIIKRTKITAENIINLAQGRFFTNAVPPNEVLALAVDGENDIIRFIVYDTITGSNRATVAAALDAVQLKSLTQTMFLLAMQINPNGNTTNGITGGTFFVNAKGTLKSNVLTRFSAKLAGHVDGVSTDDSGTGDYQIVIPTGSASATAKTGTLIE